MNITRFITIISIIFITAAALLTGWWIGKGSISSTTQISSPLEQVINPRPLEKYSFEALSSTIINPGEIEIESIISENPDFTSHLFTISFNPTLTGKDSKKTTGQLNIPTQEHKMPIIVMLRGYVDQTIYQTGIGTRAAAEVFAQNGFITVAPDFLGYADSDTEAANIFESRFQTYTTGLVLLNSLDQIPQWDGQNIFIWGHSNGGQIAITLLEITGSNIPTTLWAPVTKPFPYSILYYTDESEDRGKLIRRELAKFESDYDVDKYSLTSYLRLLNAPIQLHQGTADDAVPPDWSDSLVTQLTELEKDIKYYTYPGADHNMKPYWGAVITKDLSFFRSHLKDIDK